MVLQLSPVCCLFVRGTAVVFTTSVKNLLSMASSPYLVSKLRSHGSVLDLRKRQAEPWVFGCA